MNEHRGHHGHPHAGGPRSHHDLPWTKEEALAHLESPERKRMLDADAFWDRVGLPPGTVVADVGAGTGYFALPAARRVAPRGRVFAIDISRELVDLLRDRAREQRLGTLEAVQSSAETIPLPSSVADLVLLANVLHDVSDATVGEAVRLLRSNGSFLNLDWKKTPGPEGPPVEIRLSPEEAAARFAPLGLHEVDRWEAGPYHYAIRLERRPRAP
jgi:ubiquinone/menaquinone biosynthesis C-methylase UbiE